MSHTLSLFQEYGEHNHLDLRFWFGELSVFNPARDEIPLNEFAAAGRPRWDALDANDPRTHASGIFPLGYAGEGCFDPNGRARRHGGTVVALLARRTPS